MDVADGVYLYDKSGGRYLDTSSGQLFRIGHSNPNVIAAMKKQMDKQLSVTAFFLLSQPKG